MKLELGRTLPISTWKVWGAFHLLTSRSLGGGPLLFLSFLASVFLGRGYLGGSYLSTFLGMVSLVSSAILLLRVLSFLVFYLSLSSFYS